MPFNGEYEEDTGRALGPDEIPVVNVRNKRAVRFHKSVTLDPTFKRLWDSISQHTRYRVSVDKQRLIDAVCEKLKASAPIAPPRISIRMARIDHSSDGVETGEIRTRQEVDTHGLVFIPDFFVEVQNETDLDRHAITAMIMGSGRASDLKTNPHALLRVLSDTIKETIREQVLTGIALRTMTTVTRPSGRSRKRGANGYWMTPQPTRSPAPPMGCDSWSSGFSWMTIVDPSPSSSIGLLPPATVTSVVKNSARAMPSAPA